MADESSFLVQILLDARDSASAKIAALRAEVAALKDEAEGARGGRGGATSGLSRDLDDTGRAAKDAERDLGRTRAEHERLRQSSRTGDVRQGQRDLEGIGTAARSTERGLGRASAATEDHRSASSRLRTELGSSTTELDRNAKSVKNAAERAEEAAKSYEMFDSAVKKGSVTTDDARRGYQQFSQELGGVARGFRAGSDEALNFSRMASEAKARVGDFGPAEAEIRRVVDAYKDFDERAKAGVMTTAQVRRGYQDFASELGAVGRAYRAGTDDAERFLSMADNAAKNAKKAAYIAPGEWNWDSVLAKTSSLFDSWGIRISGVASGLRGLRDLAIIGLFQQLDTAVVGVAGGLFSMASAAVQAGAALYGALVSGLSQAVPVLGIIGATVERLKTVFQAVSLNSQSQTSQQARPNAVAEQELQNSTAIASSEHSLTNAYEGVEVAQNHVRTSQEQLTLARIDAIRNIINLSLAEKDAKLEAQSASLALTEAQRELQEAIQSGNTASIQGAELAIREAELNKQKAKVAIPAAEEESRRANRQGVGRNPNVVSATEALRSARSDLTNEKFAVEQAKDQLRLAQMQKSESGSTSEQSQLKVMVDKFSAPEKALYNGLVKIETMLKSPNSPLAKISDYIVEPVARAVDRIDDLLGSKKATEPLDKLGKALGKAFGGIESMLLGSKSVHFFDEMSEDASKNVPIIGRSFEQLMGYFQDVAKTAAPILRDILETYNKFITKLNARDSTPEGLARLSAFFERAGHYARDILSLGGAFVHLMMALGRDSAPTGGNLIDDLTKSMSKATDWINNNGPAVTHFFEETGGSIKQIGKLLLSLGETMIKIFDPSSLAAFQQFISIIILPALTKVLNVLGWITTAIMNIAKAIPGGTLALQAIAGIVASLFLIGKLYEPFSKVLTIMRALKAAVEAFTVAKGIDKARAAWEAFEGVMKKVKTTTEGAAAAQAGLDTAEGQGARVGAEDAGAQTGLDAAEGGGAAAGGADATAQAGVDATEAAGGAGAASGAGGLLARLLPAAGEGSGFLAGAAGIGLPLVAGGGAIYGLGKLIEATTPTSKKSFGIPTQQEDDKSESSNELSKFGKELEKIKGSLSDLPHGKMEEIHQEAVRLAQDPSLDEYRSKLQKIADQTDPLVAASRKWTEKTREYLKSLGPVANEIASTFKSIQESTGDILEQIRTTVHENSKAIADDLGTGSQEGKNALIANFGEAVRHVEQAMQAGKVSTGRGMQEIGKLVAEGLKEYGINPSQVNKYVAHIGSTVIKPNKAGGAEEYPTYTPKYADGGWSRATFGGRRITTAEAGHDEMVLSTDPAKAYSQGGLLNEYLRAAPKVAQYADGGFIADPGTNFSVNKEPQIVADLRKLGTYLHTTIYGISGYRSPQHSVEVGGYANDPHTRGEAADIGVGSNSRESASLLTAAELRKFGLYRPFYPASAAEINHVQLVGSSSLSAGGGSSAAPSGGGSFSLEAPKVSGLTGNLKKVAQGALNKVAGAAATYLSSVGAHVASLSGTGSGAGGMSGSYSPAEGKLGPSNKNAFARYLAQYTGLSDRFLGAWINHEQGSSTVEGGNNWLNIETGEPGGGSGPYGASAKWVERHNPQQAAQIEAVWLRKNLPQILRAKSATEAVEILEASGYAESHYEHESPEAFLSAYASGGILGRELERHLRRKLISLAVGGRAPWGGRAVPIEAHEGERVVNPMQWGEVARLSGTTPGGLDHHLGYDGKPRQSFDVGGPVVAGSRMQPITGGASTSLPPEIGQATTNELMSVNYVGKVLKTIIAGFKALNKQSISLEKAVIPFINEITDESTGVLARLQTGFTALSAKLTAASATKAFTEIQGSKGLFSSSSPIEQMSESLEDLAVERKNLEEQGKVISSTESQISKRMSSLKKQKQTPKVKEELNQLVAAYNKTSEAKLNLEEQMQSNLEASSQNTQTRLQDQITQIGNEYNTSAAELQTRQAGAQALGRNTELAPIDKEIEKNASEHINALQGALKEATQSNDQEMVATIKQEIASLNQTVTQAAAQAIADAEQAVQEQAGVEASKASLSQTLGQVAGAKGRFRESGAFALEGYKTEGSSEQTQLSKYRELLGKAKGEGNEGQVATLTEAINSLEAQIATNTQAIQDNTASVTQAYTAEITRQSQFSTGVYGGLISLLQTTGQITGKTNVAGEAELYKQSNTSLESSNKNLIGGEGGLNNFLKQYGITGVPNLEGLSGESLSKAISGTNLSGAEAQMDPAQQQAFENIISALVQNSQQIEANNKELAVLNGQLLQPQSFSSSSWTQFRDAIFTGMGGLTPSIAASVGIAPASNPALTGAGYLSNGTPAPYIGEQNINVTNPTEVADPAYVGAAVAYAMKTDR
jgi:Peptidase M15